MVVPSSLPMRLSALLLASIACATSHGTEPLVEQRPIVHVAGLGVSGSVLDVPPVVRPAVPFAITYAVFWSSSCTKHRAPEVSRSGDILLILPKLAPLPRDAVCTEDIATIPHTISATWPAPSAALRVVVRGYRFDGTGVDIVRTIRVE